MRGTPVDDGPHTEGKDRERVHLGALKGVLTSSELDNPRPTCGPCSRAWSRKTGLPARCLVERALVMRDPARGYLVIVHCHGSSEILALGIDMPTELAISARYAFTTRGA